MEFRTRTVEAQEPQNAPVPVETPNIVQGSEDKAVGAEFTPKTTPLEDWEVNNGKYGLDYLGIKEIAKDFPLNAQFSVIDKYIKGQLEERGYDKTPEKWQEVLKELETEIGSDKLDAYERLKKLSGYIKILGKLNSTKALKDKYLISSASE